MRDTVVGYVEALEARDWDRVTELLAPDVVYELPQTGERITGREAYVRFNREYPGDWHLDVVEAYADETGGVVHLRWALDGEVGPAIAFFHFDVAGRIDRVTDYWPEPYEPPPGREHLVERY